jgi:hypothetical protein
MLHPQTHRHIIDGHIIDITSDDESAIPNMEILSFQWDLIRMTSLCGAAEAAEDGLWDSDDDDPFQLKVKALDEEEEKEEEEEEERERGDNTGH